MSLLVLDPGIDSRIVDLGRPRTRSLGVSVGGAADRRSLALGNALVGNPDDAAGLEIALKGPRLRAEQEVGCVLFGAPFEITRDGYPIEPGDTFTLHVGEELRIGGARCGWHAYLCVRHGFDVPKILASSSALDALRGGERLVCAPSRIHRRYCAEITPHHPDVCMLMVLPGLQASWFDEAEFFRQIFTVTPASNRMGVRLTGTPLAMPTREMISEPVCPGSVQVTRDGQCIVLGVDGQTIGGYPKIAQVIQPHLNLLGQARPGQQLKFVKSTMPVALETGRTMRDTLDQWTRRLRLSLDAFPADRTL